MKRKYRSCAQIASAVDAVLRSRDETAERCLSRFNRQFGDEGYELNKDFVSRVRNGRFKVVNDKVAKFCEFLGVNPYEDDEGKSVFAELESELEVVKEILNQRPELSPRFKSLLRDITYLVTDTRQGEHHG